MKYLVVLALASSPTMADVYRCTVGKKTVYQDIPCSNAQIVDNPNGYAVAVREQQRAMELASRERAQMMQSAAKGTQVSRVRVRQMEEPAPLPSRTPGRDRYYDRPDRYNSRAR